MVLSNTPVRGRTCRHVAPLVAIAIGAVAIATSLTAQTTASLHGRIEVKLPAAAEVRPDIADFGAAKRRATDRRRSVVYFDSAPRAAFETTLDRRARLDQRNESFLPHVLAITAGTTVEFPNSDPTYHNVFSLSRTKSFDLGRYAEGHSKSVLFDRPGIVRVFCDIHSHMNAWILVFAHRFFAMTGDDGRYRIDNIPPGTYSVRVWNEAVAAEAQSVTVERGTTSVELNFTLSREKAPR
jgi:plastocyanin